MNTKTCFSCNEELPLTDFYYKKTNSDGREGKCKLCCKTSKAAYFAANPDKAATYFERQKTWERLDKSKNPEKYQKQKKVYYSSVRGQTIDRRHQLRRNYGLTLEEFYTIKGEQNGLCKICKRINDGYELCIDHDHVSNFKQLPPEEKKKHIRGLICSPCNKGLGNFRDNVESLLEAIQYLESFK